jgi:hypothetical protein
MGSSFRQTVASIFSHPDMNEQVMLSGHISETINRAEASVGEYIIAAQDTTYYNYTGQQEMEGLGVIQGNIRGLIQHNMMLLSEKGLPLGILHQQHWTRAGGQDLAEKESSKWEKGLQAINERAKKISKRIVAVEDREGDVFSFMQAERAANVDLLVRVYQARRMEIVSSGVVCNFPEVADHLPDVGGLYQVRIRREHKEVELTLKLKAGAVHIHPRKDLSIKKHQIQGLSLVVAEEISCIEVESREEVPCQTPAIWYLMTSLPIHDAEDISRVVKFYALRWRVERFHYTLKSGALNVEKLQFDDVKTLINALAFYSVVAWQLLALTYALREDPEQTAEVIFDQSEVSLLQSISGKKIETIRQAVLALTKIIGFAPSKKQPLPGVKVLAKAIQTFFFIKLGAGTNSNAPHKPLQD